MNNPMAQATIKKTHDSKVFGKMSIFADSNLPDVKSGVLPVPGKVNEG
jgi:hypothetical protein